MTEIITTNNRQVYFKELDYKIKSQKISRLNIFLFFLILLMIVIIILYILNSTNINISFENLKSSSSNKINEWRKPVQSNMD